MKKVAIIVRTRDRSLLLKRAIESILSQTFEDWEIVIVNNGGSTEEIERTLNKFKDRLEGNYRLINTGQPYDMEVATNIGILNSESEFIAILDDDDTWDKSLLNKCISKLDLDRSYDGIAVQTMVVYEEINNERILELSRADFNPGFKKVSLVKLARCNRFTTNSFVYRRSTLEKIGLYREDLPVLGDWEFNIRFLHKYKICVIPESMAFYHKRTSAEGTLANSSTGIHLIYDKKIRKEYLLNCLNRKDVFFGILIYLFGYINRFAGFVKKFKL